MEFDDISEAALYMAWIENNKNILDTEDIKSAFYAGFHLAFKQMTYLMEIISTITNASDTESKNWQKNNLPEQVRINVLATYSYFC